MEEQVGSAFGDRHTINLGGNLSGRGQDLNSFVRIFRVLVDGLVLFKPSVCSLFVNTDGNDP